MDNAERDEKIRELDSKVSNLTTGERAGEVRITRLEKEEDSVRKNEKSQDEKITRLEGQVATLQNEVTNLRNRAAALTNQVIGGVVVAVVAGIVLGGLATLGITRTPAPAQPSPHTTQR